MGVLAAKHDQEFAPDLRDSVECVVVQTLAETPRVNVGWVTAGCCENFRIDSGSEREMTTDAEPHSPDLAGAFRMRLQIAQGSLGVGIVAGEFFVDFIRVARSAPAWSYGSTVPGSSSS